MKIFGKEISIFNRENNTERSKNYAQFGNQFGLTYLGNNLSSCGKIRINQNTFFDIHKSNATIFSYYKKIAKMVGRYGLELVNKDGEVIEDKENELNDIINFFSIPTFELLKQQVFTQAFCGGQIFGIVGQINGLGEKKIKILDNRGMKIEVDKYGDPIEYQYRTVGGGEEKFRQEELIDNIVYYDHDIKYKGISLYNGIIFDALSDVESAKRNLYFFKNNARPDVVVILNKEMMNNPDEIKNLRDQWNNTYAGSENSHKTLMSNAIEDVKTLSMTNADLDLLNLRNFNDTKIALVFGIDKRLIGYDKEVGGSRSELDSVSQINGNAQIRDYAVILEDFLTESYKKLVNPKFDYKIQAINDRFSNEIEERKLFLQEVQNGVRTRNEYRERFDMNQIENKNMNEFTIGSNQQFI